MRAAQPAETCFLSQRVWGMLRDSLSTNVAVSALGQAAQRYGMPNPKRCEDEHRKISYMSCLTV